MILRGSVHAGLPAVRCPSCVPERQRPTAPDAGRDARVTTQLMTQNSARRSGVQAGPPVVRQAPGAGCRRRLFTRVLRNFFFLFIFPPVPRGSSAGFAFVRYLLLGGLGADSPQRGAGVGPASKREARRACGCVRLRYAKRKKGERKPMRWAGAPRALCGGNLAV